MISLGFVSAILGNRTFEEVVDFASANRFACVEMACWPVGKADPGVTGTSLIVSVPFGTFPETRLFCSRPR